MSWHTSRIGTASPLPPASDKRSHSATQQATGLNNARLDCGLIPQHVHSHRVCVLPGCHAQVRYTPLISLAHSTDMPPSMSCRVQLCWRRGVSARPLHPSRASLRHPHQHASQVSCLGQGPFVTMTRATRAHLRLAVADAARVVRTAPALDGRDVREADAEAVGVVRAGALIAADEVAAVPTHL